jgi:hypothetical protein
MARAEMASSLSDPRHYPADGAAPAGIARETKRRSTMNKLTKTLTAVAAGTLLVTGALAQSASEIRGASPYATIQNEPSPRLIVDPPLPGPLALGIFQAQYRVENLRIVPVFGPGALTVSPRIGHLHITVDDLPWWWADASDSNTVDVAGLPPGEHKVKIELVDANHTVFPGQVVTLSFTVPPRAQANHHGHTAN